jgi:hypothetical protein
MIKKVILFLLVLPLLVISQNNVCFLIEQNPNSELQALSLFTKYINVFNCIHIYAESSISDQKVLHVAAIAAELLDNNEDGFIDDINVKNQLMDLYTIMPLFAYEGSSAEELLFDNFEQLLETNNFCAGAVLYNNEIDPLSPGFWGSDASVEEILHTINTCSHIEIYPDVFGLDPNSSEMSDAMDVARGGQFLTIPSQYPEEGWYHYDDWTCDYQCMAMEYLYWCIVSNMGLLDNSMICSGIYNEWELCTPEEFEATDILMHAIVTAPQYKMPQLPPDGNYCVENILLNDESGYRKIIKKLDFLGRENGQSALTIYFYDDYTCVKKYFIR